MKQFKEYLKESARQWEFRVKIAGDFDKTAEKTLESLLNKWKVSGFKKKGTTPVQQFPLDFPKLKNEQVTIYEVSIEYPVTSHELTEYLVNNLKLAREYLVVRKPGEPLEEYQEPKETRDEALLNDPNYKEAPNSGESYYGDEYNSKFLKELNDVLKLQRKERGETIPSDTAAKFNTDSAEGTKSVFNKVAEDPRK